MDEVTLKKVVFIENKSHHLTCNVNNSTYCKPLFYKRFTPIVTSEYVMGSICNCLYNVILITIRTKALYIIT